MSRYRSLLFVHPDMDEHADPLGLCLAPTGHVDTVDELEAIRQDILLLLTTRPGERVMRPAYGCDLHRLLFSPNDDTTAGLAIHYIRRALETWEPRIEAVAVDALRAADDPARLEVEIQYRVRHTQRRDSVRFSFDLSGGTHQ